MPKRFNDEPQGGVAKRQRDSGDTLRSVLDHADELISCLQSLKQHRDQLQSRTLDHEVARIQQQLSQISKELLPSFQSLASARSDIEVNSQKPSILTTVEDGAKNGLVHASLMVPQMSTPWLSSNIPTSLPPLPKISDPELAKTVFTHPGLSTEVNYERLEWLGDAYIELIASTLIFQTFGDLGSGRSSQIREQLVRNITLAGYFRAYGLTSRAQLPPGFDDGRNPGRGSSRDKDLIKTQSDMFEAYTAAVIISDPQNGLSNAMSWLKDLWGQTIQDQIKTAEKKTQAKAQVGATSKTSTSKERLAQTIAAKGIQIQYRDLPCSKKDPKLKLPLYAIGVYLNGWGERDKLLGTGIALNKTEAGQKAAEIALQNKKLMQVYIEKRKVFLEAQRASQNLQQGGGAD